MKANILKLHNLAEKYMNIDFLKVIFTDESRQTFDESDGWAKGGILFNTHEHVAVFWWYR